MEEIKIKMEENEEYNISEEFEYKVNLGYIDHDINVDNITPQPSVTSATQGTSSNKKYDVGIQMVRHTPIPILAWADCDEMWQNMVYKDECNLKERNHAVFSGEKSYRPVTRAILLDWIMNVCEVYHLRRVTYHLTVDYLDRYMSQNPEVLNCQLQLVSVSCLFIAAKFEEIYPPKLHELVYICDGAYTPEQIRMCELLLLICLNWELDTITPSSWLNLYMQIHYNAKQVKQKLCSTNFQFPQYSSYQFVRASNLIDLFMFDPGYFKFSYSVIAASAMYYIFGMQATRLVSGLSCIQLEPCVKYMSVFDNTLNSSKDPMLQIVVQKEEDDNLLATLRSLRNNHPNLISDENHAMQTYIVNLKYFEKSVVHRLENMGYLLQLTTNAEISQELSSSELSYDILDHFESMCNDTISDFENETEDI